MKVTVDQYPKKLPGTLWGITTFFNPAGYKNKYENYRKFRESGKRQGLKLLTVELAFDEMPFEINKNDAEIVIQMRTSRGNTLWQKERLLNIGLERLPEDCDKIVWLDTDILFKNPNWIYETSVLLERYIIVQPYALAVRMRKNDKDITDIGVLPFGYEEGHKSYSMAYGASIMSKEHLSVPMQTGHTGFAWAARKEVFDGVGFYDRLILGSGDFFMSYAFFTDFAVFKEMLPSDTLRKDFSGWAESIYRRVVGSVYYTLGLLLHLWHGDYKKRFYENRNDILITNDFDPGKDIRRDKNDIWEWSGGKLKLYDEVQKYFYRRNEDNAFYRTVLAHVHTSVKPKLATFLSRTKGNFIKSFEASFRNNIPKALVRPSRVHIDASTICQLDCQLCPRAAGLTSEGIGAGFLSAANFEKFLATHAFIRQVELSNWGEIFLNPELSDIMRCAWEKGVELFAGNGANLNHLDESVAEALVCYQFRVVNVAIDGASQSTYSLYRRNGDFDKVIANIRLINSLKKRSGSSLPHLQWQFIPFGHNEHEIEKAREMALELGMEFSVKLSWEGFYLNQSFSPVKDKDFIRRVSGLGVADRKEFYEKHRFPFLQKSICAMLWHSPQINWDGKLMGCCVNYWDDFGNVFEEGLSKVLKNERICYARRMLLGDADEREYIPCTKCPNYDMIRRNRSWLTGAAG